MSSSDIADELNRRILAVAEDQMRGFCEDPFAAIAELCHVSEQQVLERLLSMLKRGSILRLRQTLPTTALTQGCLIAWQIPAHALASAFDWLEQHDPFTGHIVIRKAQDVSAPGADYRLWTTLKLPALGADIDEHCHCIASHIGAQDWACMPIVGMFTLSVGHVRRAGLPVGALQAEPPAMQKPPQLQLTEQEWNVLLSFREPLQPSEITPRPWDSRARALGLQPADFCSIASSLAERGALGRFAAVLNHRLPANPYSGTGSSALFMWAVPPGYEEAAGSACGRHVCMTHCYWRSGAERFGGVQIMGVVHAQDPQGVLAHKAAIDAYLAQQGIRVLHTAIFWTCRARIHPSEFDPAAYQRWRSCYLAGKTH